MKIKVNANSIKYFSGKSYLISIPKTDKCFWLSSKCCYDNRDGKSYSIYLNDNYVYLTARKHGKTSGELNGKQLISTFEDYEVMTRRRPEVITHEHIPDDIKAVDHVVVDNELLRKW